METLRRAGTRLTDRYLFTQALALALLGGPAMLERFHNARLAAVLGALLLAVLVLNTLLARWRWRQLTSAWAQGEARAWHAACAANPAAAERAAAQVRGPGLRGLRPVPAPTRMAL